MTWYDCRGKPCPRQEVVFVCQCLILSITILVSLYNLSNTSPEECNKEALWASLISGCLGICCPGPVIRWRKNRGEAGGDEDVDGRHSEVWDRSNDLPEQHQHGHVSEQQGSGLPGPTSCTIEGWWWLGGGADRLSMFRKMVPTPFNSITPFRREPYALLQSLQEYTWLLKNY